MGTFDYEYWKDLAERDPEQFEVERAAAIDREIRSCTPKNQPELRRLQMRVDSVRMQYGLTSAKALVEVQRLLYENAEALFDEFLALAEHTTAYRMEAEQVWHELNVIDGQFERLLSAA